MKLTPLQRKLLERAASSNGGLITRGGWEQRTADKLHDYGYLRPAIYMHHDFYITSEGRAALTPEQGEAK